MIWSRRVGLLVLGVCSAAEPADPPPTFTPASPPPTFPLSRYHLRCAPLPSTCDPQPEPDTAASTLRYSSVQ